MKKQIRILMRAAMSPLEPLTPFEVMTKNTIGSNIGNLLFPYSVSRTLMTEGVEIDTIKTARGFTKELIRSINENYDYFVLPFANAFRYSFIPELTKITDAVKQLKIPCIVVGIGMQEEQMDNVTKQDELDCVTRNFMNAILKKSNMVGVRGENTANYLKRLGYVAEKDYTVIGCPSMFMFGKNLPKMELKELTPKSRVSVNSKTSLPFEFHDFMKENVLKFEEYTYVPQVLDEIYRMYVGMPYKKGFTKPKYPEYPVSVYSDVFKHDNARSFINVPTWREYMAKKDLSFGSRIHGNIAALISGTPCLIWPSDDRITELTAYHKIPTITNDELRNSDIFKIYDRVDFSTIYDGHDERFMHYLNFLRKNGLQTIYDENGDEICCPFDEVIASKEWYPALQPFASASDEEKEYRLKKWMNYARKKNDKNGKKKNKN